MFMRGKEKWGMIVSSSSFLYSGELLLFCQREVRMISLFEVRTL